MGIDWSLVLEEAAAAAAAAAGGSTGTGTGEASALRLSSAVAVCAKPCTLCGASRWVKATRATAWRMLDSCFSATGALGTALLPERKRDMRPVFLCVELVAMDPPKGKERRLSS